LEELLEVINKLRKFQEYSWETLEELDFERERTRNGKNKDVISKVAKVKLNEYARTIIDQQLENLKINKEEAENLYELQLKDKHRAWGIRRKDALYLMWNDKEHFFMDASKINVYFFGNRFITSI
jgi:hypothetical protein